jgi:hypothetical protein
VEEKKGKRKRWKVTEEKEENRRDGRGEGMRGARYIETNYIYLRETDTKLTILIPHEAPARPSGTQWRLSKSVGELNK